MKKSIIPALVALALAPVANAETATLDLGGFNSATAMSGSAHECGMPINYGYTYSGGQWLYTNDLVKDIADKNGEITKITFKMSDIGMTYFELIGTSTLWATPTAMTEYPLDSNGKAVLQDYSTEYAATISIDRESFWEEDFEVIYTFSKPVKLAPGQGILFTASTELTSDCAESPNYFDFYAFKGGNAKAYTLFAPSDTKDFAAQYAAKTPSTYTSAFVPVAKIDYTYVDKLPQAEAPVFTPASGSVLNPGDEVTITSAEGTSVLYTLEADGTPDQAYTAPIAITKACTITAIATGEGFEPSDAVTASYTLVPLEAPVISPKTNSQLGPDDKVTITGPEGATILYTLERGATPDQTYTEPFTITKACTVTAMATMADRESSATASATYTLKTVKRPEFNTPDGTELGANEKVTITAYNGSKILYTLAAEGTPDLEYPEGGIALSGDATVRAIAVADGYFDSSEIEASFTVSEFDATVVGDFYAQPESENLFLGTNWYNAPIIPTYKSSASQMIYLPEELAGFGESTRIRTVSFRYVNESCFSTYNSSAKLYLQAIDATEFNYDNLNDKHRWFALGDAEPVAKLDLDIEFYEIYFQTAELTFELTEPFEMPEGKSLLVTVINEADQELDNSEYPQFFKYSTDYKRTATFCSDRISYDESLAVSDYIVSGDGYYSQLTDRNQPCMKMFIDNLGTQGVAEISTADAAAIDFNSADVEVYNLQGVRLQGKPAAGVYILRHADRVQKVIVK